MISTRHIVLSLIFAFFAANSSAQLNVIISGGLAAAYQDLLPEFVSANEIEVETGRGGSVGDSPRAIPNQLARGVEADVIILARQGLEEIRKQGRIVEGSDKDLAYSEIGMVVQKGKPLPDISTPERLRGSLLQADTVAVSSSTSGRYLVNDLFPALGISDQMRSKTITTGAAAVGRNEAEIGFQQVSELLPIEGATFVGRIPEELQYTTTFSAAIIKGTTQIDAAALLVEFLSSPEAAKVIARWGMSPANKAQ